eukprot:scaffold295555_cov28-Tisochrysis_lutea.AAC.9
MTLLGHAHVISAFHASARLRSQGGAYGHSGSDRRQHQVEKRLELPRLKAAKEREYSSAH